MSLRRFLVPPGALSQEVVELPAPEAAHARQVLRLKAGDEVWLLDGQGLKARAVISRLDKAGVSCRVLETRRPDPPTPRLVLCPGLLKGPAMELLAVKLCELGVDEVRPYVGPRTVPRFSDPAAKLERWQRLAAQALKQCGAASPPLFQAPAPLRDVLAAAPAAALKIMLYEDERQTSLAQALAAHPGAGEVWGLVGPEGGLASGEVAAAQAAGFMACGLGPVVLRAETASLALAAVVRLGR
ncbi:MAG: 16S rRNA (uracil(1498)-N(3))-methyltransferase [Desulfarculus sp.]|nr:16S rRNA (uracil(1498)-N(3))-methyltransferase [Desulfarculus sp.]